MPIPERFRAPVRVASERGSAARVGRAGGSLAGAWLLAAAVLVGCASANRGPESAGRARVHTAPSPSETERYCAWYGHAGEGVLYFGQAPFWWAFRKHGGDPEADLLHPGPKPIGRFDLRRERHLEPLEVAEAGARNRSGVWDVLPGPGGRVFFTTYFESSGFVDPDARVETLPELGSGLNEIAPGPDGGVLVSRYGAASGGSGSVLILGPDGALRRELPLAAPPGYITAPKTVAWDPARREIWVTTDLLPEREGPVRQDAIVIDLEGSELARIESPEVQFAAFASDGTGLRAEVDAGGLWLREVPPDAPDRDAGWRVLLDPDFRPEVDFAQDIQPAGDGRVVVTRWSGRVHVVDPPAGVRTVQLPALEPGGLYYTAVLAGRDRLCATYCADVTVVCQGF